MDIYIIYNAYNYNIIQSVTSPFQNLSLSGGFITVLDWLLITTFLPGITLEVSGTLLSLCGVTISNLGHKLILLLLICPLGVDTMYDRGMGAG